MPSISPLAEDEQAKVYFVENCFNALQTDETYRKQLLTYFEKWQFPEKNPFEFKTLGDYYNYLRDNEIRTLRNEQVKSFAECQIANYLFRQGINYQYEAKYKIDTKTPERRAYQPDFYLPDVDIYIEHFGIDRQGNTAPYIDKQSYTEGMQWKRELHKTHGTALIETFHYEQQEGVLLSL
jgi:DNA helicase-4